MGSSKIGSIPLKKNPVKLNTQAIKENFSKTVDRLQENKKVIILSIITLLALLFFYYFSMSRMVGITLDEISTYEDYIITGTELNKTEIRNKKLCDFYVACAYKPYLNKKQLFDYCSIDIFEKVLKSGVRCVYLDIFNSNMSADADPIVSSGYKEGEWKLTFNTIHFEEICRSINKIGFVQGYVNNSKDPFIICLNLKTNGNFKCLNKMKDILYKVFKKRLLDNNYTYSSVHVMTRKIKEFMGKVLIFCSDGYQNSDLEELVNYSWDNIGLKNIVHESIDNSNEGTNAVILDQNEIKNYNKNNITLVTPVENTYYSYNFDPSICWEAGCQFVFLNYQIVDKNMETYMTKFRRYSFILKPRNMLSTTEQQENIRLSVLKDTQYNENLEEEKLSCPEKPSENYDSMYGSSTLFYKDRGDDNGLCFAVNSNESCNCNKDIDLNCNDNLYTEKSLDASTNIKLCCSNRRINNPNPICDNNSGECTKKMYFSSELDSSVCNENPLSVRLQEGRSNFNTNTLDQSKSDIYKCNVNSSQEIIGKKICLLDVNNNERKNCPAGWSYTGKFDSEQNVNICCKNS